MKWTTHGSRARSYVAITLVKIQHFHEPVVVWVVVAAVVAVVVAAAVAAVAREGLHSAVAADADKQVLQGQ